MADLPSLTADTTELEVAGTITGSESTNQNFEDEFKVRAIHYDGSRYEYFGGPFTKVGSTGHASQYVLNAPTTRNRIFAVDTSDNSLAAWNPNANAEVDCIVAGPAGKLYVAGNFTTINGVSRSRLALIGDASGSPTVDTTFTGFGTINGAITGLDYDVANNKVYISGAFTTVNGTTRNLAAKLDGTTGNLDGSFNPNVTGATGGAGGCRRILCGVHSADLSYVYLCGVFTTVGGTAGLLGLCAVAKSDGALQAWRPTLAGDITSTMPHDLAIPPDGTFLIVAIAGSGNGEPGGGNGNAIVRYNLIAAGALSRTNAQAWHQFALGDGGDHNSCATDGIYVAAGHHGNGTTPPGTDSRNNHKMYLVNAADGSSTTWVPTSQPNSVQGTYAIRMYDDRMLVGSAWTSPRQGITRYTRTGGDPGGPGPGGGGGGWLQVYENRMPLGGAANTNYGPGQQGRSLFHKTQAAAGSSTAISAPTWGYGKFAAITVALTTGGGGGDTTPPTVPGSFAGSALSATSAHLSWTASTDASGVQGYTVYRDGASITTVTGTSFDDTGLTPGQTYSYTVDAFDAAGNHSAQSSAASVTTPTVPDTQAPTIPSGFAANITGPSVTLSWSASTDNVAVAGYHVIRSGVTIATTTSTTYIDSSGVGGTSYTYSVNAFDGSGNTSASSTTTTVTYPTVVVGAITVRGQISASVAGATSLGGFGPFSGTQVGDVIIASLRVKGAGLTFTAPAGWSSIQTSAPGNMAVTFATYLKVWSASDAIGSWSWSGTFPAELTLLSLSGAASLDAVSRTNIGSNAAVVAAPVTLSNGGDFLYFTGCAPNNFTGTIGAGFTELEPSAASTQGIGVSSGYINPAVSGTNGPYTTTLGQTKMVGHLIGIKAGVPVNPNTGPTVTVTSPQNGVTINSTTVTVQATLTDPDGISVATVNTLGGPVSMSPVSVDALGSGTYAATIALLTSASPGSANNFTVSATDANASPLSTTSAVFTVNGVTPLVDSSAPTITWDTPASGTNKTVQGVDGTTYGISFRATDPSGLGTFTIDSPALTGATLTSDAFGQFFYGYPLATGANAFTLHTADGIGNTGTVSFTITLVDPDVTDVTGPDVSLATPVGTFTVVGPSGTIYVVNGTATDTSGISSLTVNGVETPLIGEDGTQFAAPITLLTGSNSLTVIATDASAGLNTTTVTRTIVLENTAGPVVSVTTPAASSVTIIGDDPYLYEVSGTLTSGNGLTLFTVDSVPVTVASDGAWAQIVALNLGVNTVTIVAVDSLNNLTQVTLQITLEAPAAGAEDAFNLSTDQQRMAERLQERGAE